MFLYWKNIRRNTSYLIVTPDPKKKIMINVEFVFFFGNKKTNKFHSALSLLLLKLSDKTWQEQWQSRGEGEGEQFVAQTVSNLIKIYISYRSFALEPGIPTAALRHWHRRGDKGRSFEATESVKKESNIPIKFATSLGAWRVTNQA